MTATAALSTATAALTLAGTLAQVLAADPEIRRACAAGRIAKRLVRAVLRLDDDIGERQRDTARATAIGARAALDGFATPHTLTLVDAELARAGIVTPTPEPS